jgi:hypothetical protein
MICLLPVTNSKIIQIIQIIQKNNSSKQWLIAVTLLTPARSVPSCAVPQWQRGWTATCAIGAKKRHRNRGRKQAQFAEGHELQSRGCFACCCRLSTCPPLPVRHVLRARCMLLGHTHQSAITGKNIWPRFDPPATDRDPSRPANPPQLLPIVPP